MPDFLATCKQAALAGGDCLMSHFGRVTPREKGRADLVTEADLAAQETIARSIAAAFPDHEILGEESTKDVLAKWTAATNGSSPDDAFRWVIDPLDGTTNFVHGVPFFATSVALTQGRDVLAGVVYNPASGEFFSAAKGQGAFLTVVGSNGSQPSCPAEQRLRTSEVRDLGGALAAIGFPPGCDLDAADVRAFLRALPQAQAMRRTGSAALNLAYVAAGRFDAAWSFATLVWDIAAGVLLIQEAGGRVTSPAGGPLDLHSGRFLAAATEPLHGQVEALLAGVAAG